MPVRIPRLPKAGAYEKVCIGAAGVGVLTPLVMIVPGAEERLARETIRWAPRWERNISYFVAPIERGVQRIEAPVARTVQRVEQRLPLERVAKNVDNGIRAGISRFGPPSKGGSA